MINPDATTGDLVIERPSRARVFEQYQIDYCCHGDQPLATACEAADVPTATVLEALEAHDKITPGEDKPDWEQMGLADLCRHIEEVHHAYLVKEFPRVTELAYKVADAHGEHHPEVRQIPEVVAALRQELEGHMAKEEQILFPMLTDLDTATAQPSFHCGSVGNPIRVMESEHVQAGDALATLRRITNDYTAPEDACPTWRALLDGLEEFEADIHMHIHKENNLLFPAALRQEAMLAGTANP